MRTKTLATAICVALAFSVSQASAAVTTYNTLGAFQAATSGTSSDPFETAPAASYEPYGTGYIGAGFTIDTPSFFLYNIDSQYESQYDWGTGDVMLFSGNIIFNFSAPITAVGL